jgi:hypothetical protein
MQQQKITRSRREPRLPPRLRNGGDTGRGRGDGGGGDGMGG